VKIKDGRMGGDEKPKRQSGEAECRCRAKREGSKPNGLRKGVERRAKGGREEDCRLKNFGGKEMYGQNEVEFNGGALTNGPVQSVLRSQSLAILSSVATRASL
jgi:hypothetical protein